MTEGNEPMVSAVDMAKKYGDFIALHPLNVQVHAGEFFGVFGPNERENPRSSSPYRTVAAKQRAHRGSALMRSTTRKKSRQTSELYPNQNLLHPS